MRFSPCLPVTSLPAHPLQIIDVYDILQRKVYGLLDGHSVEHAIATGAGTLQQVLNHDAGGLSDARGLSDAGGLRDAG